MLKLSEYNQIILDFDGTVVDSNKIKEHAISNACKKYTSKKKRKEFVNYFTHNNGLPREEKIKYFFPSYEEYSQILTQYNLTMKEQYKIELTEGLLNFLKNFSKKVKIMILSGGDKEEIKKILEYHNIEKYFNSIYTAPKNKYDNINEMNLKGKSLYIGDSIIDYKVSQKFNCDFIFLYGYTQFDKWQDFFKEKNIYTIKNFKNLLVELEC